jgi:hypothetical protein
MLLQIPESLPVSLEKVVMTGVLFDEFEIQDYSFLQGFDQL